MFIAANLLEALARVLDLALTVYLWIIVIRALVSWVNPDPWNPLVQFLYRATEPVLSRIRQWLPFWRRGIDFSPVLAILAIYFVRWFVVRSLMDLAWRMR